MTTLPDLRARLRIDLDDTDAGSYRWIDSELDRHIARALEDVSIAIPQEKKQTIATTAGSRDVSLTALTGLIEVEAAEIPTGSFPPAYVGFSRWSSTLSLHLDTAPDGENVLLYFTARHVVDGSGSTLPAHMEDLLLTGAAGYAAIELATSQIDTLNLGGPGAGRDHASWGRAQLTAFRQLLFQYGRANRVRARRLYLPA